MQTVIPIVQCHVIQIYIVTVSNYQDSMKGQACQITQKQGEKKSDSSLYQLQYKYKYKVPSFIQMLVPLPLVLIYIYMHSLHAQVNLGSMYISGQCRLHHDEVCHQCHRPINTPCLTTRNTDCPRDMKSEQMVECNTGVPAIRNSYNARTQSVVDTGTQTDLSKVRILYALSSDMESVIVIDIKSRACSVNGRP